MGTATRFDAGGGMTTNTILRDQAKCGNGDRCPRRETCVRWTAQAYDEHQVFAAFFVEGAECSGYWATEERVA
jgi:hypothetical protein